MNEALSAPAAAPPAAVPPAAADAAAPPPPPLRVPEYRVLTLDHVDKLLDVRYRPGRLTRGASSEMGNKIRVEHYSFASRARIAYKTEYTDPVCFVQGN